MWRGATDGTFEHQLYCLNKRYTQEIFTDYFAIIAHTHCRVHANPCIVADMAANSIDSQEIGFTAAILIGKSIFSVRLNVLKFKRRLD